MKVLVKGRPQNGWSSERTCAGKGAHGGGCGAKLLVEEIDLYRTYSQALHEMVEHISFTCVECGVETNITDGVPSEVYVRLPDKKHRRNHSGPGAKEDR